MKNKRIFLLACSLIFGFGAMAGDHRPAARQYIELRVYHFTTKDQLNTVDSFLRDAYLPSLHRAGIEKVGVFIPVDVDTAADKKLYLMIPYKSLKQFEGLAPRLEKDAGLEQAGANYVSAPYTRPAYNRFERILLYAFEDMPAAKIPELTGPKANRVYELRSYESASEKILQNKVEMFNQGGEVSLFQRLGFNAIFYGQVISGGHMPNLMYMTSFENKAARDEHWKQFSNDPFWKTLSAKPEYQHNVSKIDITFLTPAAYSDF